MTENEWEAGRLPRAPRAGAPAHRASRAEPIATYLSLEFPRESVGWLLNPHFGAAHARRTVSEPPSTSAAGGRVLLPWGR